MEAAAGTHVFDVTATSDRERASARRSWNVKPSQGPPSPPPPPPALPCGQSLGQTKICFDDLPPGTVVGTQYSSLDVVFGVTPTGPNTLVKPFIEANPKAHSDGQILKVEGCGGEFCNDTIHGRFWHGHKYLRVWAGAGTVTKLTAVPSARPQGRPGDRHRTAHRPHPRDRAQLALSRGREPLCQPSSAARSVFSSRCAVSDR